MKTKLLSALVAATFGGCAMMTPMPAPKSDWKQYTGQIQSSGGKREVVGEITIRHDAEHFLAEVTKGPGLPLLKIYAKGAHPDKVLMRGALAKFGWKGNPAKAPAALQAWSALPEAFHWAQARADGDKTFVFSIAGVERRGSRAGQKLVELEYTRGGEKIVAHLDR